MIYLFIISY